MPIIDQVEIAPPAHYECVVQARSVESAIATKQLVLKELGNLHGWCSPFKASILLDLTLMTQPNIVVEIGVYGGKSLVPIAMGLRENRRGMIYGIDPWSSQASIEGMDGVNKVWWGALDHAKILQGLQSSISRLNLQDYITLICSSSEEATPIQNIDMLHIDGNHSEQSAFFDVNKWVRLVKPGGLILFDDTTWDTTGRAVKWLDENCIKLFETVDKDNCWGVWVKQ